MITMENIKPTVCAQVIYGWININVERTSVGFGIKNSCLESMVVNQKW